MKFNFKKFLPHIVALLSFIVIAYTYFPALLEGKVLYQSDIVLWEGGANEIIQYRNATGEEPLWTNSMFSGMPTNMISTIYKGNYLSDVSDLLFLGERPASYLIVAMIGFYLLMLAFGTGPWLALVGALAFAFCSYNFQIVMAGHNSKMVAIAFMPWVLAAAVYAFRKNALLGAVFFGITLGFEILASHVQITYYLGFILVAYFIAQGFTAWKEKAMSRYGKTLALLALAGAVGILTNVNYLWPNWEYSKYTMRGGSELTLNQNGQSSGGLSYEYATAWSYGIGESMNMLIPNFRGGSSTGELDTDSHSYQVLQQNGQQNAREIIKNMPLYWGDQPFTAGPSYMGAVMVFLFVLGLCILKGPFKWWIAGVSLLALMLAWGSNLMWFSKLFLDYAPFYNKFRAVMTTLVVLQITIPLLGIYTLYSILQKKIEKQKIIRGLQITTAVTGGICLLVLLIPSLAGSFTGMNDVQLQWPDWLYNALIEDRIAILRSDALRSLLFILLTAGIVWMAAIDKLKFRYTVPALALLVLIDMWPVDKRYLNDSGFVSKRQYRNVFTERPVDKYINEDTSHYRVLDYTVNTFQDALVSYYHKSLGGYSAAKLQRYQDLIDYHLLPEMMAFIGAFNDQPTMEKIDSVMQSQRAVNMLNTRYLIIDPGSEPLENYYALGNAWTVDTYRIVENADQEIQALGEIDPAREAVIDRQFAEVLGGKSFRGDTTARIELLTYLPNRLVYQSSAASEQLAVFSEIYYPKGWRAYIDGAEVPIVRVNYLLRSIVLPEGQHTIEMHYHPDSYFTGANISRIASLFLLAALVLIVVLQVLQRNKAVKEEQSVC